MPGTALAPATHRMGRLRRFVERLGPGFIAGVADNDPSAVATYAVAGASLGMATLWLAPLMWPLSAAVQVICSRIGMVGGRGLAEVVRRHYSRALLYPVVLLVLVANTVTLGADLRAIVDALQLITHARAAWLAVPLAIAVLAVQILLRNQTLARVLKFFTIALFAYAAALFVINVTWGNVVRALIPKWSGDRRYVETIVALVGAALSPYIFFWQSSQEVEHEKSEGRWTVSARKGATDAELRQGALDVSVGMAVPSFLMFAVTLTTAATLHASGGRTLGSAADAAAALEPLAGKFAGVIFAVGIIGTGLLAVPVLSASAAYAVTEAMNWRRGLDEPWRNAVRFYAVIVLSTLVGAAIALSGVPPVRALFLSSVVNGIVTPPLLLMVVLIGRSRRVMAGQPISRPLAALGAATIVLAWAALLLFLRTSIRA